MRKWIFASLAIMACGCAGGRCHVKVEKLATPAFYVGKVEVECAWRGRVD